MLTVDGNDVRNRSAAGLSSWLRRPQGLVAQTRWLFCLCALASLLLGLPGTVAAAGSTAVPVVLVAAGALVLIWIFRFVSGRTPVALDLVEAAAVAAQLLSGAPPGVVFGFVFPALWFRALFGSTVRVLLLCAYVAAGVIAALPLRDVTETADGTGPVGPIPTVAGMFLTASVARYLALGLFARDAAQRRDAALVRLGNRLIGVTDRAEIVGAARECTHALCAATDGPFRPGGAGHRGGAGRDRRCRAAHPRPEDTGARHRPARHRPRGHASGARPQRPRGPRRAAHRLGRHPAHGHCRLLAPAGCAAPGARRGGRGPALHGQPHRARAPHQRRPRT
jgi:hypothetical protein